jgi:hypothetical protein
MSIKVSNEFATVELSKVDTKNGERVRIRSPKLDYEINLDPLELESLTWQHPDVFTMFLETPFGPVTEVPEYYRQALAGSDRDEQDES